MGCDEFVRERLRAFLAEDIGGGDLTTAGLPQLARATTRAQLTAREPGVLAGLEFALEVFRLLDPGVQVFPPHLEDGQVMEEGTVLAVLAGNTAALLQGERTALNLLQRLSGIATTTRAFVDALQGFRHRPPGHPQDDAGLPVLREVRRAGRRRRAITAWACTTGSCSRTTTWPPRATSAWR